MIQKDIDMFCDSGRADFYLKEDPETGLKAIIAISNPGRGPALGGARLGLYPNTMAAMQEASLLAKTMLSKSAVHGLPFGGGKAVLIAPRVIVDRKAYFQAFGRFVDSLGGKYITAMDSGVGKADMNAIASCTTYVTNSCKVGGAPSAYTAKGVSLGIQAAVKHRLNRDSLAGVRVLIQGIGKVGYELLRRMVALDADVMISDTHDAVVKQCQREFSVKVVEPNDIYRTACDVFAPCAVGSVLTMKTLGAFQAKIIAGAANNPLAHAGQAEHLHARNILYVPDYLINAGGLICCARQYYGASKVDVDAKIERIYALTESVLQQADAKQCSPLQMADRMASRLAMPVSSVTS
jgi:leucine dehydrogenase